MEKQSLKTAYSWESVFPAPAKINLFLHVVGRNEKNYHLLESCFRLIDYSDYLRFEKHAQILFPQKINGVEEKDNLCLRAALALKKETGYSLGAAIFLEKNLPIGAGLGGGSSDAATTLIALNHLWNVHLPREKLLKIAQNLGADVPFFVFGENALVKGIGEELSPATLSESFYLLATPAVHCSTHSIFQHPDLPRNTPKMNLQTWNFQNTRNDLEGVALKLFPQLKTVLENLKKISPAARMTGSGSSFFIALENEEKARKALQEFHACPARVVKGLKQHPLKNCL